MAKKRKLVETAAPVVEPAKEEPQEEEQHVEEEQIAEEVDEQMVAEDGGEGDDEEEEVDAEVEENPDTQNASNTNADASTANTSVDGGAVEDDDDSEEPFQNLIEPFTKSQLAELLREASEKHSDVLDSIRKLADVDPVHRKIFVHGLGWDTTAETLISVFKQYGEIEDCKAVSDKVSGKSKGYGFILFKHRSGARKALKEPQKKIGNRMTACQLASAGPVTAPAQAPAPVAAAPSVSEYTQRKIYISNVSADIDPQKLLGFFAKFGEIEDGPLGLDKQSGKPKGFALFVYREPESARKALEEPHKNFEGHILHCQKAIDGPKQNKSHFHHQPTHSSGAHGSHFSRNQNSKYGNSSASHMAPGGGHLMAQSAGMQYNQGAQQALNPVLGQAITALLATQGGAGLGLSNLLGSLGSSGMGVPGSQSLPMANSGLHGGYGNPSSNMMGAYGSQPGMQGGYPNSQMGQPNAGRSQQGGGHIGGAAPYMGH